MKINRFLRSLEVEALSIIISRCDDSQGWANNKGYLTKKNRVNTRNLTGK
jgi:hypothetical protein